jgi:predicted nucleotidyltransferase component of viral defense system
LKVKAEAESRPFAELLDLFGLERFLHRLASSRHGDRFVLKGALLIRHWLGTNTRPTRDVDLMGPEDLGPDVIKKVLADVLEPQLAADGLEFDLNALRIEQIRDTSPLPGYRAKFVGYLGQMVIHYQVDMVPAATLYPPESKIQMAGILDFPVAEIKAYTPYSVVAEKLEAMVALGDANSRMKDYYDLAALARGMRFEGEVLAEAIRVSFRDRSTAIPADQPMGMSEEFAAEPRNSGLWEGFVRKARLPDAYSDLSEVSKIIRAFLLPPTHAARTNDSIRQEWPPGGPWRDPATRPEKS